MNIDFQEILKELEFRVPKGIINLNEESQVTTLVQILRENGVSDANELAQKARAYFGFINEDEIVKNKQSGAVYSVKTYVPSKHEKATPEEIKAAKKANKGSVPDSEEKAIATNAVFKGPGVSVVGSAAVSSAEKRQSEKVPKKSLEQSNQLVDTLDDTTIESRKTFYKKGFHKSESEDEGGSAPGNAGSCLNENGSNDICKWALETDETDLGKALVYLYGNLKGGDLLMAEDKRGVNPASDKSKLLCAGDVTKQMCDEMRTKHKELKALNNGQLSRMIIATASGLLKAERIKEGTKANGWKLEDCKTNTYWGDKQGKELQVKAAENANKIFGPDGTEIPKDIAIHLIKIGGAGHNPSDTSQFTHNTKTGDIMLRFTSDKDSFDAIVAQSSFAKEGQNKKDELDKLVKSGKMSKDNSEKLKSLVDKQTQKLNSIESELKNIASLPAQALMKKVSAKDILKSIKPEKGASDNAIKRYNALMKNYKKEGDTEETAIKKFLKDAANKPDTLTAGELRIMADLSSEYDLNKLVAKKIDDIRVRSVDVERDMLDKMNKIKINLDGDNVGLGDYMDALNVLDKFHMGGAMGEKEGVFKYKGLFEVMCGFGAINDDFISKCMGTNDKNTFIKRFRSEKEQLQKSKENTITGSVRVAYFLDEKGKPVRRIGEKRQRSKTAALGRFSTVYKWDKDTINCFKGKNGLKTK